MSVPAGLGEYFPDGDYGGYQEALSARFGALSDAEKADPAIVDQHRSSVVSEKFRRDRGPLLPHECPQSFRTVVGYKALASLIQLNSGLLAVDQALKDIIERLEPGVHQFWPIRIVMPRDKEVPTQFYGMLIRRWLKSFVPEKSDPGAWRLSGSTDSVAIPTKKYFNGLAVSQAAVGSAHLWREADLARPEVFLSDKLHDAITEAGLRLPPRFRLKAAEDVSDTPPTQTLATVGTAEWLRFQAEQPKTAPRRKPAQATQVWGFYEQYGLFSFTPAGHYPGFGEILARYFAEEMSEFEKARLNLRDGLRYAAFDQKFREDLGPLRPQECPQEFETHDRYETFPSFLALNGRLPKSDLETWAEHGRVLAVDDSLKDIIERLEPGVHQFWPMQFRTASGKVDYPRRVYGLVIRQFLDSFDPDVSKPEAWREGKGLFYADKQNQKSASGLTLSKAVIGSSHLWREKRLKSPAVFLSDALMTAINDAGLIAPVFFRMTAR